MTNPVFKPTYQHILEDDVINATTDRRPSFVRDQFNAKQYLQECSNETGQSIYDHLTEIIKRVIVERPANVIDCFEQFSHKIREETYQTNEKKGYHQETYIESERLLIAKKILPILCLPPQEVFPGILSEPMDKIDPTLNTENDDNENASITTIQPTKPIIQDVIHLQFYWQLAGYAFPTGYCYLLSCAMRKLETNQTIRTCRFWGQLYGINQNYFIVEAELTADEINRRVLCETRQLDEEQIQLKQQLADEKTNWLLNIDKKLIPIKPPAKLNDNEIRPRIKHLIEPPQLPRSLYKRKRDIPIEFTGNGVNQRIYFVCHNLGDDWIELPNVTPKQIQISRKIRKFLTGNLESKIVSFPIFPGVEKNLLRAIIARITSANYVAPVKFYRFSGGGGDNSDDEEEEQEDEEDNDDDDENEDDNTKSSTAKYTIPNPKYKPINTKKLLLLESWAHYRPNILKQGRTVWFNPNKLNMKDGNNDDEEEEEQEEEEDDEDEDEDSEDEENRKNNEIIETGPPLLTPCSEDNMNNNIDELGITNIWTIKLSQKYNPNNAMVIIRSNLWPGAVSFALDTVHDSLYFGWGSKFVTRNFSPNEMLQLPPVQDEYPLGPEIMEIMDPTVDEEEIWRIAHTKKSVEMLVIDEEGEEEDEEEEDVIDD